MLALYANYNEQRGSDDMQEYCRGLPLSAIKPWLDQVTSACLAFLPVVPAQGLLPICTKLELLLNWLACVCCLTSTVLLIEGIVGVCFHSQTLAHGSCQADFECPKAYSLQHQDCNTALHDALSDNTRQLSTSIACNKSATVSHICRCCRDCSRQNRVAWLAILKF